MLLDHDNYGRDRPPRFNGFAPDLFASDLPATFEVIGEAKTGPDLDRDRTHRQILAFLDHLAIRQHGWFYLCVPYICGAHAQLLLKKLKCDRHEGVQSMVLIGV